MCFHLLFVHDDNHTLLLVLSLSQSITPLNDILNTVFLVAHMTITHPVVVFSC